MIMTYFVRKMSYVFPFFQYQNNTIKLEVSNDWLEAMIQT